MPIPPPAKVNPSAQALEQAFLQPTQILRAPPKRGKPHQGTKEMRRRQRQLDRSKK